jgi:hypothetical protein
MRESSQAHIASGFIGMRGALGVWTLAVMRAQETCGCGAVE